MKELLKLLPLTTILISFLFVTGGCYLLGYWGTFGIDAFSIIEIWDIPKNFITPFMYSGGVILIFLFIWSLYVNSFTKGNTALPFNFDFKDNKFKILIRIILFVIIFFFAAFGVHKFRNNYTFWSFTVLSLALLTIFELLRSEIIRSYIPRTSVRIFLVFTLIFTPSISFLLGKKKALIVYENISEKDRIISIDRSKMNINISDTTYLKFLGFLGTKFIVSSLNNEKIFFLNQSAFDVIEVKGKMFDSSGRSK